jgi:hypothetical protein
LHHNPAEVGDGHVAEDEDAADESAGDNHIQRPDLIRKNIRQSPAKHTPRIQNRDKIKRHAVVRNPRRLPEERNVEELDVEAYEAYGRARYEGEEGDVREGRFVEQGADPRRLGAEFHYEERDEQGGEGHEAEDADGPGEADLGEEAVEDDRVDDAWITCQCQWER